MYLKAMKVFMILFIMSVSSISVIADKIEKKKNKREHLNLETSCKFVKKCLKMLREKNEDIFKYLTDNKWIFTPKILKKETGWNENKWANFFPGYHNLTDKRINQLTARIRKGPSKVKMKRILKMVKGKPKYKEVDAIEIVLKIKGINKEEMKCKVFLADKILYWEPFGW